MKEVLTPAQMRKQALECGWLRDVSRFAAARGFPFSLAVTKDVWTECIERPMWEDGPSPDARLATLIEMIAYMVGKLDRDVIGFVVRFMLCEGPAASHWMELVRYRNEEGETVYTVMFPEEQRFPV